MAALPGLLRHTRLEEPPPATAAERPGTGHDKSGSTASTAVNQATAGTGDRRSTRRHLIASALAVAAAATAIGLYVGTSTPTAAPRPTAVTVSATNPSTHVAASATLTPEATGTMVRLTLTGLPPATTCHLVVHANDGDNQTAASWASGHSTTDTVPASTAINRPDIASLDIVNSSGHLLVALTP